MANYLFKNIHCVVSNSGVPLKQGRKISESDLGLISNGAIAWEESSNTILWCGSNKSIPTVYKKRGWKHIDCKNLIAYPGLVDPHTHSLFAGDRSKDFHLRASGATYQEIAAAGGGIITSTTATRQTSKLELRSLLEQRICNAFDFGIRLLECKSSYGLNLESELVGLSVIASANNKNSLLQIIPTSMSAHAIPAEYKSDRSGYVQHICEIILPAVKKQGVAKYVDVFCDQGYFSLSEAKRISTTAKKLDLSFRIHADELADTGAASLAAEVGAHSADHLLKINSQGIRSIAQSDTVATLLPGTALFLREPYAPARKLIDAGAIVALATDFNPGTCPTQNLPFIGSLAILQMGMTYAETIAAITWNAARSLRREADYGTISTGKRGLPAFCEGDHPAALFYRFAGAPLIDPRTI